MHQFAEHPDVRYGLATMCVGLGQGGSVLWENLQTTAQPSAAASA